MITKEQAINANTFHEPRTDGSCRTWRRNGKTKLWVTRPNEFRVPVKHGLYSYGYITQNTQHLDNIHVAEECPHNV